VSRFVVTLDGSEAPLERVGAKAAALDRLIAHGLSVPRAAVVSTDAYRQVAGSGEVATCIDELRRQGAPSPDRVAADEERVEALFARVPLPDGLEDELAALAASAPGSTWSVRSSSTAEDESAASFAGQYRSVLDVAADDLPDAVRSVWASLWSPGVRAYREAHGSGDDDFAMAVLLMPMVDAERAGVAFTVDPSDPDSVRVESVAGVAESLVSGSETPEAHRIPRSDPTAADVEPLVRSVADLALDVERRLGGPQDIEWAHDGRELHLLQARPITMEAVRGDAPGPGEEPPDDGFDTPPLPGCTYSATGVAELLPGVVPPLQWTINGTLLEEGFRHLFDRLGVATAEPTGAAGMVGRFRGRAALNVDVLKRIASAVPGASPDEIERQYFGEVGEDPDADTAAEPARRRGPVTGFRTLTRAARLRTSLRQEAEVLCRAVDEVLALSAHDHGGDHAGEPGPAELLARHHRLTELGARVVATQVAVAATAAASYRGVELLLRRWFDDEAATLAQRVTSGGLDQTLAEATLALGPVSVVLVDHPDVDEVVRDEPDLAQARKRLARTSGGDELLRRLDQAMRGGGSRAVFAGPTWAEDPEAAWDVLHRSRQRSQHRAGTDPEPRITVDDVIRRLQARRGWTAVRIITGQIIDARARAVRRLCDDARDFLVLREHTKAAVLRLGGEERRALRRLGQHLVALGALDDPDDVDLLGQDELAAAVQGGGPDTEELARRREALEAMTALGPLPRRFQGRPGVADGITAEGDVLRGWAASAGTHQGRPRVVTDPRRSGLQPGEVLVATSTDPTWTPLFTTAGALVIEEGGPLSHAAIVARELGVPAVLNLPGAIRRLDGCGPVLG
jgi:rifampicin phosphotransferase